MKTTMMNRGRRFCLALFVCACLAGGAARAQTRPAPTQSGVRAVENVTAPQGWQRYEIHYPGGLALRVVLPAAPEVASEKIPMGTLPAATQYLFTSTDEKGVYVIGYLEGLPPALVADPDARKIFFNGLWKGFADGMSQELKKNNIASDIVTKPLREVSVSGQQAQVQDFSIGNLAGTARAVLTGGNAYLVVHVSLAPQINAEGNAFINSFELRPKR